MPLAIQGIDEAVLLWIQEAVRQAWLDPVVKAFTTLGNAGILWIVLSVAMLFWRPTRKAGLLAGCALIFSLLFTNLGLKLIFTRPRPYTVVEGLIPLLTSGDPNSFPSGHTCAAFSAGLVWARTLPKPWMRRTAVIQAVLMGLSRLYVGVHYPSDVLAAPWWVQCALCWHCILGGSGRDGRSITFNNMEMDPLHAAAGPFLCVQSGHSKIVSGDIAGDGLAGAVGEENLIPAVRAVVQNDHSASIGEAGDDGVSGAGTGGAHSGWVRRSLDPPAPRFHR